MNPKHKPLLAAIFWTFGAATIFWLFIFSAIKGGSPFGNNATVETADLAAQRSMADAAWAMFSMTFVSTAVGAVGIWLVFRTFQETRQTNIAAQAQVKPYLRASNTMVGLFPEERLLRVIAYVDNLGLSPAVNAEASFKVYLQGHDQEGKLLIRQFWLSAPMPNITSKSPSQTPNQMHFHNAYLSVEDWGEAYERLHIVSVDVLVMAVDVFGQPAYAFETGSTVGQEFTRPPFDLAGLTSSNGLWSETHIEELVEEHRHNLQKNAPQKGI